MLAFMIGLVNTIQAIFEREITNFGNLNRDYTDSDKIVIFFFLLICCIEFSLFDAVIDAKGATSCVGSRYLLCATQCGSDCANSQIPPTFLEQTHQNLLTHSSNSQQPP